MLLVSIISFLPITFKVFTEIQKFLSINQLIERFLSLTLFSGIKIAGETTDFVNTILEKFKSGVPEGGLKEV